MESAARVSSLLIAAAVFVGCRSEAPEPARVGAAPEEAAESGEPVAPTGPPKISADAAVFEFGAIKVADSVEHVFKILNTGGSDLIIEGVRRT